MITSSTERNKRRIHLLVVGLLAVYILGATACGSAATTIATTPSRPAATPAPTTRRAGIHPLPSTSHPGAVEQTTTGATVPSAAPTQTPATSHVPPPAQPPVASIAPSPSLERWPAQSSVPILYQPRRANPGAEAPLAGMTVLLDAGHGGRDPGAIAADGTYEKAINLPITLQTRTFLEQMGATVILTRADDRYLSIYARVATAGMHILQRAADLPGFAAQFDLAGYARDLNQILADNTGDWDGAMEGRGLHLGFGVREEIRRLLDLEKQFEDTIFVSIHANSAAPDTTACGLQIYYSSTEYVYADEVYEIGQDRDVYHWGYPVYHAYTWYDDAARAALAGAVFEAVAAAVPALGDGKNAGVRVGNYGILREQNLASVLVECGFMSNVDDLALLKDPAVQNTIAQGIATGIRTYFLAR